ncbi:MAG: twin-arginine translocation signal domain-containing protein, partial [Planctomycetota bacterium]
MNRRQFIKESGLGALALGLTGSTMANALSGSTSQKGIEWSIKPGKWRSLGPLDIIPQLDEGQQWANHSLIKYGTVEPPNGGLRCMRSACMPA